MTEQEYRDLTAHAHRRAIENKRKQGDEAEAQRIAKGFRKLIDVWAKEDAA